MQLRGQRGLALRLLEFVDDLGAGALGALFLRDRIVGAGELRCRAIAARVDAVTLDFTAVAGVARPLHSRRHLFGLQLDDVDRAGRSVKLSRGPRDSQKCYRDAKLTKATALRRVSPCRHPQAKSDEIPMRWDGLGLKGRKSWGLRALNRRKSEVESARQASCLVGCRNSVTVMSLCACTGDNNGTSFL